jgi:predicted nucleic-acid-binding protein
MIGLDTNILLRAATQDNPVQSPIAQALLDGLDEASPGYINSVVMVEFTWSLSSRYRYERSAIIVAVEELMQSAAFTIADREAVNAAIARSEDEGMHFADALIGELNRIAGCSTTMTFDKPTSKRSAFTQL